MGIEIRRMTLEDLPEIMKMEKELFTAPWSEYMFFKEIKSQYAYVLVNKNNEQIIGYVCGLKLFGELSITNLAVKKEFQRCGFGEKLIKYIINKLLEEKCFKFFLEVRESNHPAIKLYEKFGFEQIGIQVNYYNNPVENAVMMKLNL